MGFGTCTAHNSTTAKPDAGNRQGWGLRRWEAAETNRLNSAQWKRATDHPINADLASDLVALRARCAHEIKRNPVLEGVVKTFAQDIAGEDGPVLLVESEDEAYNEALQGLWWDWFDKPEITGRVSGADMIQLWVRRLLDSGEYLAQRVSKQQDPGPVAFRLKLIHPRRLITPPDKAGDQHTALGVTMTAAGEPVTYHIAEPSRWGPFEVYLGNAKPVPARSIIHEFITIEEDQVRGVPWLAPALQTTADLRDLDAQVLDAVRAAADQAVVWYTDHPDANYLEVNEVTDVERRMQQTGPPGWKPMQMTPEQPGVNFGEYRSDRLREVGRPIGMPLMMIRLGSEQHNFSSARFDNEVYKRGIRAVRRFKERRTLYSLVEEVKREGELYAAANPQWKYAALARPPKKMDYGFVWQPLTAVDAEKDAQDEEARMANGTLPYEDACANGGRQQRTNIEKIARTVQMFRDKKLPMPKWMEKWIDPTEKQATERISAANGNNRPPSNNGSSNGNGRHLLTSN